MEEPMPEKKTVERARRAKREGKAPTTQAGEFVREEIHHVREGKHGARSPEQAIAIGLSKARRAGVKVPPPEKGEASEKTRESARRALKAGEKGAKRKPSPTRSRATSKALKGEGKSAASPKKLAEHAHAAAERRTAGERSAAAKKAARTKGPAARSAAAKKAARTNGPAKRSAAAKKAARTKGPAKRSAAAKKAARTKGPAKRSAAAKKAARTRAART
jgi:uncharacterized protein DUF6496